MDSAANTISLTADVEAETLPEILKSYGASMELFTATGRPVASGKVRAGMVLQVTSEDGTKSVCYTFVQPCLSQGKPIEASSYQNNSNGNNPPDYMNDGDDATRWAAGLTEDGGRTTYPQWVQIDLEAVCSLERIDVSWFQGSASKRAYHYTVSVSEDGKTYRQVADRSENTAVGVVSDTLDGAKARYIRLDITGNSEWPNNASSAASIYEIRVYGEKAAAEPVDKKALRELYDAYKDYKEAEYTADSWLPFAQALAGAKTALDEPDATQTDVAEALTALQEAEGGLKKRIVRGDLDGNGVVNISDVMEACKVLARKSAGTPPTKDEIARGDLDENGDIQIGDVMMICKILALKG